MPTVDAHHLIKVALSLLWREAGTSQLHILLQSTGRHCGAVLDGATLGGAAA